MNPVGSAKGSVAGSCEYGDEPAGSGARELVLHRSILLLFVFFCSKLMHFSFQMFSFYFPKVLLVSCLTLLTLQLGFCNNQNDLASTCLVLLGILRKILIHVTSKDLHSWYNPSS
jgi:hypothetical protein